MAKRIGVLVVHGMGEQKEFEHRDSVARSLVQAWQKQKHGARNVVQVDSPPLQRGEPVKIVISDHGTGKTRNVEIREVYWGDADENPQGSGQRLIHSVLFWRWALSQWALKRYSRSELTGASEMCEPVPPGESAIPAWVRAKLLGVGIVFALLGVTWELARFLLRRLRVVVTGSSLLARYLGDVALYTEDEYRYRPEAVKLTDSPRDAIRRRMVRGLVDMACERYERWYVVAHSLGSVVAHNGLMELQEALPNYLDQSDWTRMLERRPELRTRSKNVSESCMRPPRPCWLDPTDAIDRSELFKELKGFCTYGSPLNKFATLWPAIVPTNRDRGPLQKCKWVNVHDWMDPVAGSLGRYARGSQGNAKGPGECGAFEPCNVAYKSSWLFILAHIRYLQNTSHRDRGFAESLAAWIAECAWSQECSSRFGGGFGRKVGRSLWWLLLAALALTPLTLLVSRACETCIGTAAGLTVNAMRVAADSVNPLKTEALAAMCVLGGAFLLTLGMTLWQSIGRKRPANDSRQEGAGS